MEYLLLSVSSDEVDGYLNLLQKWSGLISNINMNPIIFWILVLVLLIIYATRFAVVYYDNKSSAIQQNILERYRLYVLAHTVLQYLVNFFIAYLVIKLGGAKINNYAMNWIIAPTIGLFCGLFFDYVVIVGVEEKTGLFKCPLDLGKSKSTNNNTESSSSDNEKHNITINVGGRSDVPKKEEANMEENIVVNATDNNDVVANLVRVQEEQGEMLKKLTQMVEAMSHNMMCDKKIELEEEINACLVNGYATTKENSKITSDYVNYRNLGGNGVIKELYEKHYVKLPIR